MMMCVKTIQYAVVANYDKVVPISSRRGIRQREPLSLFLFIIVAQGLTSLLRRAENKGDIHGIKICRKARTVLHLLFADDCFLFCRENLQESVVLKNTLY